jgi:hypothetical protein
VPFLPPAARGHGPRNAPSGNARLSAADGILEAPLEDVSALSDMVSEMRDPVGDLADGGRRRCQEPHRHTRPRGHGPQPPPRRVVPREAPGQAQRRRPSSVIAANAHAGRPRSAAAATAAPEIGCLTKRLTNSLVLAGRDDTRWTGRRANRLLNVTRWTRRHPLDGVLIAHDPKVAGSNSCPATHVMSQDIGNGRTCVEGSAGFVFLGPRVVVARRWVLRCRGSGGWGRW